MRGHRSQALSESAGALMWRRVKKELEAKMHKPGMVTFPARRAGKTAIQAEMMKRKLEDRNE